MEEIGIRFDYNRLGRPSRMGKYGAYHGAWVSNLEA
jgi:hypothetical protein